MPYQALVGELRFVLDHVVGLGEVLKGDLFAEVGPDLVGAILTEAGRLSEDVLAPLQRAGDRQPARLENGVVRTSPGFVEGFRAIAEGGWVGMSAPVAHGGMGLPQALTTAVNDMMAGACLSLQLNPMLTQGQIEALERHASAEMKALYLPKLISGDWTGTMNLTEAQAGSDVGALTARAEPRGDGSFSVFGQKIYITWGDHDCAENVCHLVLARLPDGVPGTKGISLFLVPKYLPDAAGRPGLANRLAVVSLEHKLGIHGSPTAVMQYDGAQGWLVGAPHQGMRAMFDMMNNARLGVAAQGVGVAEAAFQLALSYAKGRKQGGPGMIIDHPDVRRMLATMKAEVFAARAITLGCAVAGDMARAQAADARKSAFWAARAAFLTPIAKAFGTDTGVDVASMGIQVHGGMGFIEESGAAQYLRDVRITPIYEGTNGIQAADLVTRKLADGGAAALALLDEAAAVAQAAGTAQGAGLGQAVAMLREATEALAKAPVADRLAGSTAYLRAFARVLGGQAHVQAARADPARAPLAALYTARLLPEVPGLLAVARAGAEDLFAVTPELLSI